MTDHARKPVRAFASSCSFLHRSVAGFALAAVFCCAAAAQEQGFTLTPPRGLVAQPISNARFDQGYGLSSADGSLPVAGTSSHPCIAGFKAFAANNGLSRAQINRTATSKQWRDMARAIIGTIFTISSERTITVQGYRGLEMAVTPKIGAGAEDVRGLMSVVETPKGRMTVVCMTTRTAFSKAVPLFRAVPKGARMPE